MTLPMHHTVCVFLSNRYRIFSNEIFIYVLPQTHSYLFVCSMGDCRRMPMNENADAFLAFLCGVVVRCSCLPPHTWGGPANERMTHWVSEWVNAWASVRVQGPVTSITTLPLSLSPPIFYIPTIKYIVWWWYSENASANKKRDTFIVYHTTCICKYWRLYGCMLVCW